MPVIFSAPTVTAYRCGRTLLLGAVASLALTSLAATGVRAEGDARIIGLWKLVSYEVEVRSSGEKDPVMGAHPTGYAYFTPEGRVFFNLTGEDRKPAKDPEGKARLLDTIVAYTGKFTTTGDQWTTRIDTAWNPDWIGTDQTRTFKLDGKRLTVLTPWRIMPNWAKQGETRSIVTFERATDG
ncbi:lipocalin-like domain-containing protein [Methylobacterium sp. Leaf102]|uniref:lipocalin-like domain-containing protein n=1 Tax=Methylobacterium sp. Leaf102 TaxID=1736253 RepID=UPI0009E85F49|nr:lipocalin-like domain-containing protein [Methylobacterium sp. Leaf102]USU30630.1 lipocalin-like domain-containing protein [Methylobacterium sp. OTU13CASTA1]